MQSHASAVSEVTDLSARQLASAGACLATAVSTGMRTRMGPIERHSQAEGQLLRPIPEDGPNAIEGSWEALREVKPGKLPGGVGHGKDHAVTLPLQSILDAKLPVSMTPMLM